MFPWMANIIQPVAITLAPHMTIVVNYALIIYDESGCSFKLNNFIKAFTKREFCIKME